MGVELVAAIGAAIGVVCGALGTLIVNVVKAKKSKTEDLELQYNHSENLVKLAAGQSQDLIEIKNSLIAIQQDLGDTKEQQEEVNRMLLRRAFLDIYFRYEKTKEIPEDQFESALDIYTVYKNQGGNGYIETLKDELKNWKRI